jgi:flagellar protein FlgJ
MTIPPSTAAKALEGVPIEKLGGLETVSREEKVREAARQFEAVLLRQILGQARKPVFRSELSKETAASGIYQDMVTAQLAEAMSRGGTLGLARSLETQLSPGTANAASQAAPVTVVEAP